MYEQGELNITPDYQRLFRWNEGQRSRFIDLLLLEMPVPPILVIEEEQGAFQLIGWVTTDFFDLNTKHPDFGHTLPEDRESHFWQERAFLENYAAIAKSTIARF